jgi:hypothetical protein
MTSLEALSVVVKHIAQSRYGDGDAKLADVRRQAEEEAAAATTLNNLATICALVDREQSPGERAARFEKAVALMKVIDASQGRGRKHLNKPIIFTAISRLSRCAAPPSVSDTCIATAWRRFGEETAALMATREEMFCEAAVAYHDLWFSGQRQPASGMYGEFMQCPSLVANVKHQFLQQVMTALTGEGESS